jgi:hypothetical protein
MDEHGLVNAACAPASLSLPCKAPEGWRSPKRFACQEIVQISDRSWTAAALRRFSLEPDQLPWLLRKKSLLNGRLNQLCGSPRSPRLCVKAVDSTKKKELHWPPAGG